MQDLASRAEDDLSTASKVHWRDTQDRYGLGSILLHWTAAAVVIALWFIGSTSQVASGERYGEVIALHTTIAIIAYALLLVRIAWRLRWGHPGPLPRQRGATFHVGKMVHYGMLGAMTAMILTGPLLAWARSSAIDVGAHRIGSPFGPGVLNHALLHGLHSAASVALGSAILLHLAGVAKHAVVNKDETFSKMIVPARAR